MSRPSDGEKFGGGDGGIYTPDHKASIAFGGFWLLTLLGSVFSAGPWAGFHAVLFLGAGLLMAFCPPVVRVSRLWWTLGVIFIIFATGTFLPAEWFEIPVWRKNLEMLGLETGSTVVIQTRLAAEALAVFGITLLIGFWLLGHRASPRQLRTWALAFTGGVAIFAVLSKLMHESVSGAGSYGFFPNRNHTATYLAMGTICGLGSVLQAIRDKRFISMAIALVSTAVCLWAVAGWSISRGGIVLVAGGSLVWVALLGRRYLGNNGIRALGLIVLAAVGFFVIADSVVKERISKTVEKAESISAAKNDEFQEDQKSGVNESYVDFRMPIALDTLDLIKDFKWTGIGAGQFKYVFPQYRHLSSVANNAESVHPESDWLWMASEAGIPATLMLASLVVVAFVTALVSILRGRDRALRASCLVAAVLVPAHGIFDVPGHRISLALSAVLLFTLSMRSSQEKPAVKWGAWAWRGSALGLLGLSVVLARAEWGSGFKPATISSEVALKEARDLFEKDLQMQKVAIDAGLMYMPETENDPLEQGLVIIAHARTVAPLDRGLLWYQAFLAFHYEGKQELIIQSFAIERALDPTWVASPLRQAEAWKTVDQTQIPALWKEAVERAEKLDPLQTGSKRIREKTLQYIKRSAKGSPGLEVWEP